MSAIQSRLTDFDRSQLPYEIRELYRQTLGACEQNLDILAPVGIRALVEIICKKKRSGGRNLKQRINNLVKKGILSKRNAIILHRLRLFGNKSAHNLKEASFHELRLAFQIIDNLIETVFIHPRETKYYFSKEWEDDPSRPRKGKF